MPPNIDCEDIISTNSEYCRVRQNMALIFIATVPNEMIELEVIVKKIWKIIQTLNLLIFPIWMKCSQKLMFNLLLSKLARPLWHFPDNGKGTHAQQISIWKITVQHQSALGFVKYDCSEKFYSMVIFKELIRFKQSNDDNTVE